MKELEMSGSTACAASTVMNNVVWDLLDNGTQYIDTIAYSAYYASAGAVI